MKQANERVAKCLAGFAIDFEIRILPEAVRTARLAADALGCEVGQIANSLIFRDHDEDRAPGVGAQLSEYEAAPVAIEAVTNSHDYGKVPSGDTGGLQRR